MPDTEFRKLCCSLGLISGAQITTGVITQPWALEEPEYLPWVCCASLQVLPEPGRLQPQWVSLTCCKHLPLTIFRSQKESRCVWITPRFQSVVMSLQIKHSHQVISSQIPDCYWFYCAKRNGVLRGINILPFHRNKQGIWISKLIYPVQILAMPERLNSLFSYRPDDFMIISHFSCTALRPNLNFFISWHNNCHYPIHFVLRRSLCGNLLTCSFCSSFLHTEYCSLWRWFSPSLHKWRAIWSV